MKESIKTILAVIIIVTMFTVGYMLITGKINFDNTIPSDYIAVFHGGIDNVKHETYIYKINNNQANYGFKYINVLISNGSGLFNSGHKIVERGKFDWTDDAFKIARTNNAYSYVTLPNDATEYTIEEFQKRFIMD